ncbi:barstar family protein [Dactylosporangium sp. CA-139066]|uniref:barstar family protein n=1 Tax=Dactylosporangium sp. CA-139066 TaxID=3239930 RepID=UPI003D8D7AEC
MSGWLLRDEDDEPIVACADIEGLFADLPPRAREEYTLVGCVPDGPLAAILRDGGTGWLGNVWLAARPGDPATRRGWVGEQLLDVTVLRARPSAAGSGLLDVDLDGIVQVYDRTDAVWGPADVTGYVLSGPGDEPCGGCADVTGVFRGEGEPPVPWVVLRGCRSAPRLDSELSAEVCLVGDDGAVVRLVGYEVTGTVVAVAPSGLGDGLVDVTVSSDPREPHPAAARGVVERWRGGRPGERNLWGPYDRALRHEWLGLALSHAGTAAPDRAAGATYELDGRFVTDIEGFYCAIGEAINGPGGYFGWNLDALDDCFAGGFGARPPFRLVWRDAAVARGHLVEGYDRHRYGPAITLDHLLAILTEHRIDVELR